MRPLTCLALLLIVLGGCRAQPSVTIDPRTLDCVPVVALAFRDAGNATALVLDDGTLLTCSHALPPEAGSCRVQVNGVEHNYHIVGRGLPAAVGSWKVKQPPVSLDDWAAISLDQPMNAASVVGCTVPCVLAFEPPRVGETVYLVGYTAEFRGAPGDSLFVRYWVPLIVVPAPRGFPAGLSESVVWLRTGSRKFASPDQSIQRMWSRPLNEVRPGFSGAPVLRVGHDASGEVRFEVCAILPGKADGRSDYGAAIVPGYAASRAPAAEATPTPNPR